MQYANASKNTMKERLSSLRDSVRELERVAKSSSSDSRCEPKEKSASSSSSTDKK